MSIWIATGVTHGYLARAEHYLASLREHESHRATLFSVDFTPGQDVGLRVVPVDYRKCLKVDKWMMQNGSFVTHAPADWSPTDVVAFTDADCALQRPLSNEEIDLFTQGTRNGGVMIGRNKPDPTQTLAEESHDLFPKAPPEDLARRFPGMDRMLAKNTGFVVARLATWRDLYADVQRIWPMVEQSWGNPARVQMSICLVVQSSPKYQLHDLPLSIHAHAHLGMPPGVEIGADGVARANGKVIFYRHVL